MTFSMPPWGWGSLAGLILLAVALLAAAAPHWTVQQVRGLFSEVPEGGDSNGPVEPVSEPVPSGPAPG